MKKVVSSFWKVCFFIYKIEMAAAFIRRTTEEVKWDKGSEILGRKPCHKAHVPFIWLLLFFPALLQFRVIFLIPEDFPCESHFSHFHSALEDTGGLTLFPQVFIQGLFLGGWRQRILPSYTEAHQRNEHQGLVSCLSICVPRQSLLVKQLGGKD